GFLPAFRWWRCAWRVQWGAVRRATAPGDVAEGHVAGAVLAGGEGRARVCGAAALYDDFQVAWGVSFPAVSKERVSAIRQPAGPTTHQKALPAPAGRKMLRVTRDLGLRENVRELRTLPGQPQCRPPPTPLPASDQADRAPPIRLPLPFC